MSKDPLEKKDIKKSKGSAEAEKFRVKFQQVLNKMPTWAECNKNRIIRGYL